MKENENNVGKNSLAVHISQIWDSWRQTAMLTIIIQVNVNGLFVVCPYTFKCKYIIHSKVELFGLWFIRWRFSWNLKHDIFIRTKKNIKYSESSLKQFRMLCVSDFDILYHFHHVYLVYRQMCTFGSTYTYLCLSVKYIPI